jgi:hypothetical protein
MRRFLSFFFLLLSCLRLQAEDMPEYLKTALRHFSPGLPAGWAYSVSTLRGRDRAIERFDPTAAVDLQWTLLERDGRKPSEDEQKKYRSYKTTFAENPRIAFTRGDLDLGSLHLEREDTVRAEYTCRFRSDISDPLLSHLRLALTVTKQPAFVERSELFLVEPFSPVLGVKNLELKTQTAFSSPTASRPSLPLRTTTHFRGKLFLIISIEEDLQSDFSDFVFMPGKPVSGG